MVGNDDYQCVCDEGYQADSTGRCHSCDEIHWGCAECDWTAETCSECKFSYQILSNDSTACFNKLNNC